MPGAHTPIAIAVAAAALAAALAGPTVGRPSNGPAAAVRAPAPAAAVPLHGAGVATGPSPVPIGLAPAGARVAPRPGRGWQWPLRPAPAVQRGFAVGPHRWSPGHRGVDLAPGADGDVPVLAAGPGVVRFTGVVAGRPVVSVDHGSDVITTYEPVRASVAAGGPVRAGQVLGVLSAAGSHCAPSACLHWGAIVNRTYVDPLMLLRPREPPILLPVLPR